MAIKSALELAMERASNIKIDKNELKRKELEVRGKEAASKFLNTPKYDFLKWFTELENDNKNEILQGVVWVFVKNITLPNSTADIDKLLKIKEGFLLISNKKEEIENIFTQLITAFQQYIDNSKTLLEQAKTEFAPRLQQKAMQIAQQTGQMIPIEPETDRDFIEFHRDQQIQVDDHYKEYIKQATEVLKETI
ncbi:hypothetical protein EW093_04890 [Thiospirochaeta perfilievii]|uniref:Uncharacterized protein n=1 Tax=Thiospirochaeta perfilievii TaxID=252967 RepID=A0A5C1Q7R0_9SPIO|nr:DUF6657 family protein [Thiospirochaeta perfilievii]QEN04065.1 hypothetical protein EW093_04890 [Thiospirochaeta perfilievii]